MAPRPHVLVASSPIYSHFDKQRIIAADLVSRGYPTTFLTGTCYKSSVLATGAKFLPLEGFADYDLEKDIAEKKILPLRDTFQGGEKTIYDCTDLFIPSMSGQYTALQRFLRGAEKRGEQVIVVAELMFLGMMPMVYGGPGLKPAGSIGIGIIPIMVSSVDTAPFGMGLQPDSSPEGRMRNEALRGAIEGPFTAVKERFDEVLTGLGAKTDTPFIDALAANHDLFLQCCIEEIEYPRSDLPPTIRYVGAMPSGLREKTELPSFWDEVTSHKKKMVVVTQGTVTNDPKDLIIPALKALEDMDVLVVCCLVRSESIKGFTPPANTRLAKFIPFDDLFKYADLVISNGGYGTVQQAFIEGVPMVVAGTTEDKLETCARAQYTGAAIAFPTDSPEVSQIKEAVEKILSTDSYKQSALLLKERYTKANCLESIASAVDELAARALTR